jgi:hypothetical protein
MTLIDIISKLKLLDRNETIYAVAPWTFESEAVVEREENANRHVQRGMEYFLEVSIAEEFLTDWQSNLGKAATPIEACERLIQYAICDA